MKYYSTIFILLSALYCAQGLSLVSQSTFSRAKIATSGTNVNGYRPISSSTKRSSSATKLCSTAAAIATDAGDESLNIKYGPGKLLIIYVCTRCEHK